MTPIKFNPATWQELKVEGYRLVKIPSHLFPDKGWMDVLGYVGQSIDEPSIPVIQLPNGQVRKCYCLYIVPPNPPTPKERVSKWLSAALDDPNVCAEMKCDIRIFLEEE